MTYQEQITVWREMCLHCFAAVALNINCVVHACLVRVERREKGEEE